MILDFRLDSFYKNIIGRKIYYRDEPAIIEKYLGSDDLRIIIIPDKSLIPFFKKPGWLQNGEKNEDNHNSYYYEDEYKDEVISNLLDKNIYWYRE